MKRGVTLVEMMLVIALVALLYTMLLTVTVQIARTTRRGTEATKLRLDMMKVCERLRWQLRSLFVPPALARRLAEQAAQAATNSTAANSTTANLTTPADNRPRRAGVVGVPDLPLWGQRGQKEGQDVLLFLTSDPVGMHGVAEVGYQLRVLPQGRSELVYRQFPVRDVGGFHPPTDFQEAPWTGVLRGVTVLTFDYTTDGSVWQREWDDDDAPAPRRVRVHMETDWKETLDFEVTPGMGAGRW